MKLKLFAESKAPQTCSTIKNPSFSINRVRLLDLSIYGRFCQSQYDLPSV
jgi:hypothetical protein